MNEITETSEAQPVRVVESDSEISINLEDTVDIRVTSQLHDAARQAADSQKRVRVEWSKADHVDLSALQVLLALKATLTESGRDMEMTEMSPRVRQHVEAAGLARLFLRS